MKQIPNLFTLLNLVFGCLAIVSVMQNGLTLSMDDAGGSLVVIPEKYSWHRYLSAVPR